MKPIVFVLQDFDEGGVQRVTLKILNQLAKSCDDVTLFILKGEGQLLHLLDKRVKVHKFKHSKVVFSVFSVFRIMKKMTSANIVSAIVQVNILISFLNMLCGFKHYHVITEHTHSTLASKNAQRMNLKIAYMMQSMFYMLADKILCVSNGIATDLISRNFMLQRKVRVVFNPVIDDEFFVRADLPIIEDVKNFIEGKKVILGVGRMVYMKDFELLIDSFFQLQKYCKDSVLVLIGSGPLFNDLESKVAYLKIKEKVYFTGHIDNPLPYFKVADVFLLTSKYEGFGLVLVEALALSKSVVSVDCECGPREIISNVGTLVAGRDAQNISLAVLNCINKPTDRNQMLSRAEEFKVSTVIERYIKEFN